MVWSAPGPSHGSRVPPTAAAELGPATSLNLIYVGRGPKAPTLNGSRVPPTV